MEDLKGKVFGCWSVLYKDQSNNGNDIRYICRCECGKTKSVLGKYLVNGKTTSCGCKNRKFLNGKRFGKLTVLETIYGHNGYNRATYKCMCDCGNIIYVKGSSIYKTNSCGCSRLDKSKSLIGKRFGKLFVKEILPKYKDDITYCLAKCDCGNECIVRVNGLTTGNTTSCGCIHSPSLVGNRYGNLVVEKYLYTNDKSQKVWKCKCDCGAYINVPTGSLTTGNTTSCGCSRFRLSKGEMFISDFFKEHHIDYETQKTFPGCKNKKLLRFDFYLPKNNIVIEYDGEQHFKPIDYFGGEESFNILKQNDKLKTNYCNAHNIKLIRFTYKDSIEYIRKVLCQILLNPVTTTVV